MASHAYIIAVEKDVIEGREIDVESVVSAFENERKVNGGRLYHENHDLWGTLFLNVAFRSDKMPYLKPLQEVLSEEFV